VWDLRAPGVWRVFLGAVTMASQGQVIFWRYGIICICFGRGEGGNCVLQTPWLYHPAARSFQDSSSLQLGSILHSPKLLKYQYRFFYTISKAM